MDEDDFADELFEKELNKQNLDEDDEGMKYDLNRSGRHLFRKFRRGSN